MLPLDPNARKASIAPPRKHWKSSQSEIRKSGRYGPQNYKPTRNKIISPDVNDMENSLTKYGFAPRRQERSKVRLVWDLPVAAIFLLLLCHGIKFDLQSDMWNTGDWLINYHAGFVRRGLPGEVILGLAHAIHIAPTWLVALAQMLCYLVLLTVFRNLVRDSSRAWWIIATVVSPGTLGFALMNLAGAYRKDVLFLASLATQVFLLAYRRISDRWVMLYLCVALPLCVLSSEVAAFYLPYYFTALLIASQSWRRSIRAFIPPAILASVATVVSLQHVGNLATARAVCVAAGYSWDPQVPLSPCNGSILALSYTRQAAHRLVLHDLAMAPVYRYYPLLALLSFLPIFIGLYHLRRFRALRLSVWSSSATLFLSGSFSLVLFYYGSDWGRWIYLHASATALLILLIERAKQLSPDIAEDTASIRPRKENAIAWLCIAAYALCWQLPYWPKPKLMPFGIIPLQYAHGIIPRLLHRGG